MLYRRYKERAARLLNSRRLQPGQRTLQVRELISPLRYDVVVRAELFAELRSGTPPFQRAVPNGPYFVWFKHVECARYFPDLLDDPDALVKRYQMRVARAQQTLASFERRGFDDRHPVTLVSTPLAARTDAGTMVSKTQHIGDGCHRLALLLLDGRPLEPQMYRVRPATAPVLDNTAILLRHLHLSDQQYCRFISPGFSSREHEDLAALRAAVARECPARLAELDEIVRCHRAKSVDVDQNTR